jgi:hypothetical protein
VLQEPDGKTLSTIDAAMDLLRKEMEAEAQSCVSMQLGHSERARVLLDTYTMTLKQDVLSFATDTARLSQRHQDELTRILTEHCANSVSLLMQMHEDNASYARKRIAAITQTFMARADSVLEAQFGRATARITFLKHQMEERVRMLSASAEASRRLEQTKWRHEVEEVKRVQAEYVAKNFAPQLEALQKEKATLHEDRQHLSLRYVCLITSKPH